MRVEWLNPERTRARLTKGWFRKRTALVHRGLYGGSWYYDLTGEEAGLLFIEWRRDRAIRRDKAEARLSAWEPVAAVPRARLVERGNG